MGSASNSSRQPLAVAGSRRLGSLALLCASFAVSGAAHAWGAAGHETIGAIADALLRGTPVEASVRALLGTDLRTASVWADCVKGVAWVGGEFRYRTRGAYPECAPFETPAGEAAMVDYVARNWTACAPAPGADPCHKQYHYTDVAVQRRAYGREDVGTSDRDVVAAVRAAVQVLGGKPAPPPFSIRDRAEAVLLLAHLVGDLHQPLHVGALYLDRTGRVVDPDHGVFDPQSSTRGGNLLLDHGVPLHREWDEVGVALDADHLGRVGVARARRVPITAGSPAEWPAVWATQTLRAGALAFHGIVIRREGQARHSWPIELPPGYAAARARLQERQLVLAGAHLAQLLAAVPP